VLRLWQLGTDGRQKGLKTVFDEAIRAVLAPAAERGNGAGKKKTKKNCVIL
jgi:hypothetical protein